MIVLNEVPFEKRARFLHDSMCAYPESPEYAAYMEAQPCDVDAGLRVFHGLIQDLYADTEAVSGKDDHARYLNLIATAAFLYAICAWGRVLNDGIVIEKDLLKQHYKRGSWSKRQKHLACYGLQVSFTSPEGDAVSMGQATHVILQYPGCPDMLPAAHGFASSAAALDYGKQKPLCNNFGMFLRADFQTALLGTPNLRRDFDPLRSDLLGIFDAYLPDWCDMAGRLVAVTGMQCTGLWSYGGVPAWGVSFSEKGKRPLAIFTLVHDVIFIEFTLPMDAAVRIILKRHAYSDTIREKIEGFHCVKCPKQCKGANLTRVDGVWLCSGRAEARRIYTYLEAPEDFASIHAMVDEIYGT